MNVFLLPHVRRSLLVLLLVAISASHAAAQSLPAGWTGTEIGTGGETGSTTFNNGTFTITGSGNGVNATADRFRFVYRSLAGNGQIVARVTTSLSRSTDRVGLVLRESLAPAAKTVVIDVTGAGQTELRERLRTNGTAELVAKGRATAPVWLRLDRQGSVVTVFSSGDGTNWTRIAASGLTLPDNVLVGLGVVGSATTGVSASFANVTVTGAGAPTTPVPPTTPSNTPPTVSLTAPAPGATVPASSSVTVSANAADANGSVARVDFYAGSTLIGSDTTSPYSVTWPNVAAGSYSLTAVARDNAGATTTSAAVAITVGSTAPANTPPTVSLTAPAAGAVLTALSSITVSANAADANGSVARVDFYAGSTLIGSDTTSPYSVIWPSVAIGGYTLTAVARDNAGATTTSAPRTVSVTAASSNAPNVSLTTPLNGATFNAPGTLAVAATASDSDGSVTSVEFYAGTARIGTDTTSPYAYTWTGVPAGQYSLTAVARDNAGNTTVSSAITVTVASATAARTAVFVPSSNHDTAVDRYVIDFYPAGANPATANAVGTIDVGRPAVVNGECRADVGGVIQGLPAGQYFATVTALGSAGQTRSAPSATFTR